MDIQKGKPERLTNEELALAVQAGKREELLTLWEQNSGLIAIKARRVLAATQSAGRADIDMDDLMQSAFLGLVQAVTLYNPAYRKSLTTLLDMTLRTAFAEATGYRTERKKHDPLNSAISINTPVSGKSDDSITLEDTLVADNDIEADLIAREEKKQLRLALNECLAGMLEVDRIAVKRYYLEGKSNSEISAELGCTDRQATDCRIQGLKILRKPYNADRLIPFLSDKALSIAYGCSGLQYFKNYGMSSTEAAVLEIERGNKHFK